MTDPLLTIRGLTVAFPDARLGLREVVHGIDLDVERGRVVALVGESGSGKSVTAQSVLRLHPPDVQVGGRVLLDGADVLGFDAAALREARGGRVGMVFQEPMAAWNPVQTVGRQISEATAAHAEPRSRNRSVRVTELLAQVGIDDPARIAAAWPHQLSGGQLQRAMIAMAMSGDPELLIADEPTTDLDVTVQAGILDLLRRLVEERGTAILLITHNMGVVADLADDVAVMGDGSIVEYGPAEDVLVSPRDPCTRGLLAAVPQLPQAHDVIRVEPADPTVTDPSVVAQASGLEVTYGSTRSRWRGGGAPVKALREVDLTLLRGRTLGLVGESGSGKSTLGGCLTGLLTPTAGSVRLGGADLTGLSRRQRRALMRRVGLVFQDPSSSLDPKHHVSHAIAEPLRLDGWSGDRIRARVDKLLGSVDLEPSYAHRYPHQLSGGQRQRVVIARALALSPELLVADEPTSALDVSVQARVLELIRRLQRENGFACLFISHDLAVVGAISDEVAVMRDGVIVERGSTIQVLTAPAHPYTISLLAAAPVPDPRIQRGRREGARS